MGVIEEMAEFGLSESQYEALLEDMRNKKYKLTDAEWADILDKYNISMHYDTLRKAAQPPLIGSVSVYEYFKNKAMSDVADDEYLSKIEAKKNELRKERVKLQTANIERSRLDRAEARQEMYYEYIGSVCNSFPLPEFAPITVSDGDNKIEYFVAVADVHYGANFVSENNEYSTEIAKDRFEDLTYRLVDLIANKKITKLHIGALGDMIQGILRISDVKLNESSVVKATVEISRIIAKMLNELSVYTYIEYYHVPTANHTQIRPLGTKASELGDEDLEYVIGHYIEDLCANNERINFHFAEEGKSYVEVPILGYDIIAMHGHTIKNMETSIRDLSAARGSILDYLLLGHFHSGKELPAYEGCCHDCEVLVAPSFIGSDPYSDSIMKGSKSSVKVFGFDEIYGHTETFKIVLN